MHDLIASVFSITLTALGLSYLVQTERWTALYNDLSRQPSTFVPVGMLLLATGMFIAIAFDDWSSTWPIFITAFGWLMAVEGALLIICPGVVGAFPRVLGKRLKVFMRLGGLLVLGLGLNLVWVYLLQSRF